MEYVIKKILPNLEGEIIYKNKVYSVPFVKLGDTVHFVIKKNKLRPVRIIYSSEKNDFIINPECKYFGICGGCKGQNWNYDYQWELKTSQLMQLYKEKFNIDVIKLYTEKKFYYRNRMDFVVEKNIIGLRQPKFYNRFVDIDYCYIQKKEANYLLQEIRKILKNYPELSFNRENLDGLIKYITIRIGNNAFVIFTLDEQKLQQVSLIDLYNQFIQDILNKIPEWEQKIKIKVSVKECYVSSRSEVSNVSNGKIIYGDSNLSIAFGNLNFNIPPDAFFQPNPDEISSMFDNAIHFFLSFEVHLNKINIIDLYCGAGVLSIYFINKIINDFKISSVTGMDITESVIELAQKNFQEYFDINSEKIEYNFLKIDLSKYISFTPKENSILIIDPPRSGLHPKVIEWICNNKENIKWIFYLSCNPEKQWKDIEYLKKYYTIQSIIFADPFPHTPHWESLIIGKQK